MISLTQTNAPELKTKVHIRPLGCFRLWLWRNSRQSGKQKRYDNQTVGNLSLHASGDELDDENYIQRLAECSKANGQKQRETPARETKLLQDFANSYDKDDATGDET